MKLESKNAKERETIRVVDSYPFSPKTGWQETKMTRTVKSIKAIEFAGWRVVIDDSPIGLRLREG